jgi:thymidylate kinase
MAAEEPQRWLVVDADRAVDEVQCDIRKAVQERLNVSER